MNSWMTSKLTVLLISLFLMVFSFSGVKAQRLETNDNERTTLPWGVTFGAYLSSRGGGGQINYAWGRGSRQFMISIDGYTVKDSRETPIESAFGEQGGDYTYGKLNYVFIVSPTAGIQQNLFPSGDQNLINFRWSAQVGPAFAFLIPYKLEIFTPVAGRPQYGYASIESYDPITHGYDDIIRRAKLFNQEETQSLDAITNVGASFRTNMLIDFSKADDYVGGIQLGFGLDWFSGTLPIMAFVDNKQVYVSGTVGVVFGLRN